MKGGELKGRLLHNVREGNKCVLMEFVECKINGSLLVILLYGKSSRNNSCSYTSFFHSSLQARSKDDRKPRSSR